MPRQFTKYPKSSITGSKPVSKLASAKAKTDEVASAIEEAFNANGITAELFDAKTERFNNYTATQTTITFIIEGDWRHSHRLADGLVRGMYPNVSIDVKADDESEVDDWYVARHTYRIRTDKL